MPLPSKYKSEKEKPILSLTKGTLYNDLRKVSFQIPICLTLDSPLYIIIMNISTRRLFRRKQ